MCVFVCEYVYICVHVFVRVCTYFCVRVRHFILVQILFPSSFPSSMPHLFSFFPSVNTLSFRQRDRIGVVGPNGVGKSTFLKVLTGSLELAAGSVRLGDTVRIGYYEQVSISVTSQTSICPSMNVPAVGLYFYLSIYI
jgi:ABC-type uncharacterized transport system ATPase subunit